MMRYSLGLLAVLVFSMITASLGGIIPPPPGNQCVSTNGQGLGKAIRELVDLLPAADMLTIYIKAVTEDPEVQEAIQFLESDEFLKIIVTMHNKQEFSEVMEYLCEDLHFDAYYYLNNLGNLFNFPPMTRPPPIYGSRQRRDVSYKKGFRGLLLDLQAAIPIDTIRATYKRLYADDEYLRLAMAKLGSDDFRRIGDAIEALPEYQHMLKRLQEIGVDVEKILNALMDFFHWQPRPKP